MKNIVAYQTEHATSRFLIELFANGINEYSKTTKVLIKDINEFLKVGFPSNINGIIVHGILRGTGLALNKRIFKLPNKIDSISGRGLFIIHECFDDVRWSPKGNRMQLALKR